MFAHHTMSMGMVDVDPVNKIVTEAILFMALFFGKVSLEIRPDAPSVLRQTEVQARDRSLYITTADDEHNSCLWISPMLSVILK